MKKAEVKTVLKSVLKSADFWILILMIAAGAVLTWRFFKNNPAVGRGWFFAFVLIEVILEAVAFLVLRRMRKKNAPTEKKFLFMAIFLGALFIILMPLGEIPDEVTHFRRAYGVTQGHFIAENREDGAGNEMPSNIMDNFSVNPYSGAYKDSWDNLWEGVSEEENFQIYTNTAIYNPICYLPQIIGAAIGRIFGMSIAGMAYLMRVLNFAVFVALIYFAIKISPKFKTIILFIALLPIAIQEGVSLSPDALTNGLSIFMVAYVLYLRYGKTTKMKRAELITLYVMAVLIGFLKIVYAPLVLLYLTIPVERFGSKKAKWLNLGGIAAAMLVFNGVWLWISMKVPFATMRQDVYINTGAQLKGIVKAPVRYAKVVADSVDAWSYHWLWNMLGMELGAFSFRVPATMMLATLVVLVIVLTQREDLEVKKSDKMIYLLVMFLIIGAMLTTLYLQWTEVGAGIIDGIQGRYFLPILILIPVIIAATKKTRGPKKNRDVLIGERGILYYTLFINITALTVIAIQNL